MQLVVTLLALGSVFAMLAWLLGPALNWMPIDFCRFYRASKMILNGRNPYGSVPFFSPPWLAFILSPLLLLPCSSAAVAWVLMNTTLHIGSSQALATLIPLARRHRLPIAILSALLPYGVFVYITGQLSILALVSCTLWAWGLERKHQGALTAGLLVATLKPHIVVLPMLLVLLELIRRRRWSSLLVVSAVLASLSIVAVVFVPAWPPALLRCWADGAFYEPRENLLGLAAFGVPVWLTYPFGVYTLLLWWQRRLDVHTLALGVAVNLLVIPYSRSYDYVVLLLPLATILRSPSSARRGVALVFAILAQLLPLIRAVEPAAGLAEALAPTLCTAGLLAVSRLRWKDLVLPGRPAQRL